MAKQVIDPNTNEEITVSLDTPCHAGKNGALPIMLDTTLDATIFKEMEEKEAKYAADAPERVRQKIKKDIVALEAKITPRRLREAMLNPNSKTWLIEQDVLIKVQRAKLNGS